MKRKQLFALLVLLVPLTLALAGCEDATPVLAGTPTPAATATPLPDPFSAEITAVPEPTDALGSTIDGADHYWQYLSLGELRVYEYEDGTFLDGICVNAYPLPLNGKVNIVYRTDTGKICGIGTIHNALGTTQFEKGTNAIYAEISTDIDVTQMDFQLEIETQYQPVVPETTPAP